ncbi:MAG TPA: immune inhibitor A domain-containing protein [Lachnospiraceae bacterium]|nr:immune inhibitor A domain-containing protein [Lachnospiraceae bacterium]
MRRKRKNIKYMILFTIMLSILLTSCVKMSDRGSRNNIEEGMLTPMENFYTFLPRTGNVKALVFMVEFPDVKFEDGKLNESERVLTAKELEQALFGKEDESSPNYPYESARAYYERSSYNRLHFSGTVLSYQAKEERNNYDSYLHGDKKEASNGYEKLIMEVIDSYKDQIDFSEYDANDDNILDAVYLSVPTNGSKEDETWWGNQSTWYNNKDFKVQGERILHYVILDGQPFDDNIEYYNQVWIHETGHLLGLPDYYHVSKADGSDWEGFHGEAGYDIMDEMYGDHNSFSKLMCGWIPKKDIQVALASSGQNDYILKPYEEEPCILIIPLEEWKDNYCAEYYLLEYQSGSGNNTGLLDEGGIRIWHVDAKLIESWWNNGYEMFAYDQNMTDSEKTVLTLVGDERKDNFYRTGDYMDTKNESIAVYHAITGQDEKAYTNDFSIRIGECTENGYELKIVWKDGTMVKRRTSSLGKIA